MTLYRTKLHPGLVKDRVAIRQQLYAEFLLEAQRVGMLAMASSSHVPNQLTDKLAELRPVASLSVMEAAKTLAAQALTLQGPKSANEAANFFALKTEFVAITRKEINDLLDSAPKTKRRPRHIESPRRSNLLRKLMSLIGRIQP